MVLPHIPVSDNYYADIKNLLAAGKDEKKLFRAIVDAPFLDKAVPAMFGLGIVVLLLVNKKNRAIDRISVSSNELTQGTFAMTPKPFHEIRIPLDNRENYIAIAIRSRHYMITSDWQYLFVPELTAEEARFNQAGGGIACSAVYPLLGARDGGALIFSFYEPMDKIGPEHHAFMKRYSDMAAKALK